MSAPDIILLTPNGRFELGKKVSPCPFGPFYSESEGYDVDTSV